MWVKKTLRTEMGSREEFADVRVMFLIWKSMENGCGGGTTRVHKET